jgi:hypothetical protein
MFAPPPGGRHCVGIAMESRWLSTRCGGHQWVMNASVLWILAVILVVAGIIVLLQGSVLLGILLIVVGLLVGPGGVSVFNRRT